MSIFSTSGNTLARTQVQRPRTIVRASALRPLHCASVEGQSQVPSACGHGALAEIKGTAAGFSAAVTMSLCCALLQRWPLLSGNKNNIYVESKQYNTFNLIGERELSTSGSGVLLTAQLEN